MALTGQFGRILSLGRQVGASRYLVQNVQKSLTPRTFVRSLYGLPTAGRSCFGMRVAPEKAGKSNLHPVRILCAPSTIAIQERSVVNFSKKGKRKTVKAVAKRFRRVGNGLLKRWRSCRNHLRRNKRARWKKKMRKPVFVTGKQLKKLNKMISGW